MRIILLGPPGAGKGTQAATLAGTLKAQHISTGDMLRAEVAGETELGMKAKAFMDRGDLVPDSLIIAMIQGRLKQGSGMILDGFPRTVAQAQALDNVLATSQSTIDRVVYFRVPDKELVKRLSGRATCADCKRPANLHSRPPRQPGKCDHCGGKLVQREDDRPEAVLQRLKVYQQQTLPVLAYYQEAGKTREIDAVGSVDEVRSRLLSAIA
jgi:adenylate kinase